ncbi:CDP-glucose 4,6-dehydratase [Leptolyngbya sp. 7M]|uniref:CDP-glucose 4,6-dehydratase n=1 Tax=Leptolyngbya sp. 7M TaxID=2812896 RepID=UPI0021F22952|nr:CDP-glucose 4,6-dehydratase [Leptolyngbya sp. 7M]
MITPNFWHGKRVFVTGHTGFKGSWLSLWLQLLGSEVLGFSLQPPTQPNLFDLAQVNQGMQSVTGDIRNLEFLKQIMSDFQPEIVIHMAAQPLVRRSYAFPLETLSTNVIGTANVMEAIRYTDSVRAVVDITSDKCYENREWVWGYREDDRLGGYDPYSSSKACAELVVATYRNSFFNPSDYLNHGVAIATTRAGNVIGGGDWAEDRLVPDILKSILRREPAHIRNPYATRPWQHVLEPLNGYLMLAERLYNDGIAFADSWNFGPDQANVETVGWIADRLYSLWGEGLYWEKDSASTHVHENTYLKLDCSKAKAKLDWHPKLDLDATLSWIVEWTKAFQAGVDMRQFTESQINRFMVYGLSAASQGSTLNFARSNSNSSIAISDPVLLYE